LCCHKDKKKLSMEKKREKKRRVEKGGWRERGRKENGKNLAN